TGIPLRRVSSSHNPASEPSVMKSTIDVGAGGGAAAGATAGGCAAAGGGGVVVVIRPLSLLLASGPRGRGRGSRRWCGCGRRCRGGRRGLGRRRALEPHGAQDLGESPQLIRLGRVGPAR